jgi:octaprenyl-diphosphate synthase
MASTLTAAQKIKAPIQQELGALEIELREAMRSPVGLVSALGEHLTAVRGKRLRPALVFLAAKLGRPDMKVAVKAACAVELVHTATLLHDDSIDRSYLRRGLPTVNKLWNDQVSVIMGDHLFCRAFKILHESGLPDVAAVLAAGSDSMTYGEMFQMDTRGRYDISEETYLRMIEHKTASLFVSACEAGAIVGGLAKGGRRNLALYGRYIGMAFQVVDDILDFVGEVDVMGKPVGNDFKDGRVTLPLIAAIRNATSEGSCDLPRGALLEAIGCWDLERTVSFIRQQGGVEYARGVAVDFGRKARECLTGFEPSPATSSLRLIAEYVLARTK